MNSIAKELQLTKAKLSSIYAKEEAKLITEWLFEDVLQCSKLDLIKQSEHKLSPLQNTHLESKLLRLLHHEPIQYVLGHAAFFGMDFLVNKHVLIPRPETEELVEWCLNDIKPNESNRILDIGTGSGCMAIVLAKKKPATVVSAIDISKDALMTAKKNADLNEVNIEFAQLDILTEIPNEQFDIILSNPPYISTEEKNHMRKNVLDFEPSQALFAETPLTFYQRIKDIAPQILNTQAYIYLELNEFYAEEIAAIFNKDCHFSTEIRPDMQGKKRMLKVRYGK